MRISTSQVFSFGLDGITRAQQQVLETQQQLSSGRRINSAADDPVAATQILRIEQEIKVTEQFQVNADFLENRLSQEEVALNTSIDVMQRIRELTVQAGDGALNFQDRGALATELRQRMEQLQDVLNTRDSSGEYLFAGFQGGDQPFVERTPTGFRYVGDAGQRSLQISPTTTIPSSDSGLRAFVDIPVSSQPAPISTATTSTASGTHTISTAYVDDRGTLDSFVPDDIVIEADAGGATFTVRNAATNEILGGTYNGVASDSLSGITYVDGARLEVAGVIVQIDNAAPLTAGDQFTIDTSVSDEIPNTVRTSPNPVNAGDGTISRGAVSDQVAFNAFFPEDMVVEFNGGNLEVTDRATGAVLNGRYGGAPLPPAEQALTAIPYVPGTSFEVNGVQFSIQGNLQDGDQFLVESSPTQDLLTTVDKLVNALESLEDFPNDIGELQLVRNITLANLDQALDNVNRVRTDIGARLNVVDSSRAFNEDLVFAFTKTLSDIRDTDFAEAASNLSQQTFVLQAAQQSFARVANLSLFNFLR